ncbi:MAG: nucleotidyl transferase AbiEii/AbiGii toxin family protein [Chloroflexota bacterium]
MRDYLASRARSAGSQSQARNITREYLQARILESMQRAGAMIPLAFHSGTALRFLYSIPRFSEDLDFALERPCEGYDFPSYLREVQSDFRAEGYPVEVKANTLQTMHSAFVRFSGLPFELGLSRQRGEILAIKIEVETNPPAGAGIASSLVNRQVVLNLQHHDQPSLRSLRRESAPTC